MPSIYYTGIEERSSWSSQSHRFTFVWNWNTPQSQPGLSSVPVTSLNCQSRATWNWGKSKYLISSLQHLPCCMWPSNPKHLNILHMKTFPDVMDKGLSCQHNPHSVFPTSLMIAMLTSSPLQNIVKKPTKAGVWLGNSLTFEHSEMQLSLWNWWTKKSSCAIIYNLEDAVDLTEPPHELEAPQGLFCSQDKSSPGGKRKK